MGLIRWAYSVTVKRHVEFGRQLGRNANVIGKGFRRGLPWNRRKFAPIFSDMTPQHVLERDQEWVTMSASERKAAWEAHDREVHESMKSRTGVWSLTSDPRSRLKALRQQAPWYWGWSLIMAVALGIVLWANLVSDASLVFRLGYIAFFLFLAPEYLRYRISRAQLLYGGKVSLKQVILPLPQAPLDIQTDRGPQ